MVELKPCPFCGGEAELDEHQEYRNISSGARESAVAVYCATCGAQHSICRGDVPDINPAEVVEMWNRRTELAALRESREQQAVVWFDMTSAPKDGSMLRLLVRPSTGEDDGWTPFADSTDPYVTIGFNALSDTGEDKWQFAGWDWSHDCFTEGDGEVIGWLPFHPAPQTDAPGVREVRQFQLGDRVTKIKGSSWTGRVVGFYSTALTPIGYAVESENEPGSVQIYPEAALSALQPDESANLTVAHAVGEDGRPTERAVTEAWQPIETAPRDGTTVLLFAPGWESPKTGWTYGGDSWQDAPFSSSRTDYEPTHWMPLPAAPALAQEGK